MNKKGFAFGTMADFWAVVAFVIIIIVFFIISQTGGTKIEFEFTGKTYQTSNDLLVLTVLRTDATLDGITLPLSDQIKRWYFNQNKYQDELEKELERILSKMSYEYMDSSSNPIKTEVGYEMRITDEKYPLVYVFGNYFSSLRSGLSPETIVYLPAKDKMLKIVFRSSKRI